MMSVGFDLTTRERRRFLDFSLSGLSNIIMGEFSFVAFFVSEDVVGFFAGFLSP